MFFKGKLCHVSGATCCLSLTLAAAGRHLLAGRSCVVLLL